MTRCWIIYSLCNCKQNSKEKKNWSENNPSCLVQWKSSARETSWVVNYQKKILHVGTEQVLHVTCLFSSPREYYTKAYIQSEYRDQMFDFDEKFYTMESLRVYGLSKMHKTFDTLTPFRPINDTTGIWGLESPFETFRYINPIYLFNSVYNGVAFSQNTYKNSGLWLVCFWQCSTSKKVILLAPRLLSFC